VLRTLPAARAPARPGLSVLESRASLAIRLAGAAPQCAADRTSAAPRASVVALVLAITAIVPFARPARAASSPMPWETTGTSSVADVPDAGTGYRVERRAFQKKQHLVFRSGFSYLARGDFYANPGIGVDVAYYPEEALGIDIFSGTFFFSSLTSAAAEVRRDTGLLPDSQKPIARITTGARLAFAYGKLFMEAFDTVIHLDASFALHVGALVTDQAPNLGGDLGLALQIAAYSRFIVWTEGAYFLSYERRTTSSFASGLLVTIGVGLVF
jgi:hypothetical protein